jgi:hypothetical protein
MTEDERRLMLVHVNYIKGFFDAGKISFMSLRWLRPAPSAPPSWKLMASPRLEICSMAIQPSVPALTATNCTPCALLLRAPSRLVLRFH